MLSSDERENSVAHVQLVTALIIKVLTYVTTIHLNSSFCENQNLTAPISCGKDKKKKKKKDNFVVPVIVSVVGILILILTVAAVLWRLKRKRKHGTIYLLTMLE